MTLLFIQTHAEKITGLQPLYQLLLKYFRETFKFVLKTVLMVSVFEFVNDRISFIILAVTSLQLIPGNQLVNRM